MKLARAVRFAFSSRACNERNIRRHLLAARAARKDFEKHRQVRESRNDFLYPDERDVNRRQRRAQTDIAFIFYEHDGARFGDQEISSCNPHLSSAEFLSESVAGDCGQFFGFAQIRFAEFLSEQFGDVSFRLVYCRSEYVRRFFVRYLDDVFAEVRLNRFDACMLKGLVQFNLFSNHRLALDRPTNFVRSRDAENDFASFFRVARPVNFAAKTNDAFFELNQVSVEVSNRFMLDSTRAVAQSLAVAQLRERSVAFERKPREDTQPRLQILILSSSRRVPLRVTKRRVR